MKVLLVSCVDAPGGIATWARSFMLQTSLEVTCLDTTRRYMDLFARRPLRRAAFGAAASLKLIVKGVAIVRRESPDVAYINCPPSLGLWFRDFPMLFILARLGIPTVAHLHGGSVPGFFGKGRLLTWLSVKAFRQAAAVLVITRPVQARAEELLGYARVRFLPNMLPADFPMDGHGKRGDLSAFRVLHVGAQSREKGTLDVLQVAALLPDLEFLMVGPVPADFQAELDERLLALGLTDRVKFTGPLTGDDLQLAYSSVGLMLFPTHAEGFPMVVLEAMAHGLPVVATDVGAISEMLGVNTDAPAGYVVSGDCLDVEEFAGYVSRLAASPRLREELGSNGRRRVRHEYDAATIVGHLDSLIRCIGDGQVLPQ